MIYENVIKCSPSRYFLQSLVSYVMLVPHGHSRKIHSNTIKWDSWLGSKLILFCWRLQYCPMLSGVLKDGHCEYNMYQNSLISAFVPFIWIYRSGCNGCHSLHNYVYLKNENLNMWNLSLANLGAKMIIIGVGLYPLCACRHNLKSLDPSHFSFNSHDFPMISKIVQSFITPYNIIFNMYPIWKLYPDPYLHQNETISVLSVSERL